MVAKFLQAARRRQRTTELANDGELLPQRP